MVRIAAATWALMLLTACTAEPVESPHVPVVTPVPVASANPTPAPSPTLTSVSTPTPTASGPTLESDYWRNLETVPRLTKHDFAFAGNFGIPEQPPAPMNPDGTAGSGCHPPTSDSLPDGLWAVYVKKFKADALVVDLVCSYHFESATYRDSRVQFPGNLYVDVNNNATLRTIPLDDRAQVLPYVGDPVSARDFIAGGDPRKMEGTSLQDYWIYVNDGRVTQFYPRYDP